MTKPTLSIVIPAWNEEGAIAATLDRTLAARALICATGGVGAVEILVVDDGSTDQTAKLVRQHPEVTLVSHPRNLGYGAAIKSGFAAARGELLGFLDADGTCDPAFFAELCRAVLTGNTDIAIGSRLGAGTRMPPLRRLGNRLFASILNLTGNTAVTDSASGMRVLRRSALARLYPLPDGMHFTPAMSSLALFDPHLSIVELPMRYDERTGASKLRPLRDGVRFLRIILDTALTYRPFRFLGVPGLLILLLGMGYGLQPVTFYLAHGHLEERMIYRLVAVMVAMTTGITLVTIGLLGQQTVALIHEDFAPPRGARRVLNRVLHHYLIPWGLLAIVSGVALNWRSLLEYATTRQISAHWIYVLTGGLLVAIGVEFLSFGVMARVLTILAARKAFPRDPQ